MSQNWDLLYIFLNASSRVNSVQQKVLSQIAVLNQSGIKTKGLFVTLDEGYKDVEKDDTVEWLLIERKNNKFFTSIRERAMALRGLQRYLSDKKKEYKYFYIRNTRPGIGWLKILLQIYPHSIIEHQTIEIKEINNLGQENKFGLRPAKFLSWLEFNFIPLFGEIFFGPFAVSLSGSIVGVTDEITRYELKRAFARKPHAETITNGIIINNFTVRKTPKFNGVELHLLMLVGGSTRVDWHGIDLIIEGIKKYNGETKIYLHLAGINEILSEYHDAFVIKHGYCNREEIEVLISRCHLALGTFAFLRKGLNEASTLKMREYGARGIPVVYGHFDPDYKQLVEMGLALKLPSMIPPDMYKVVEFAKNVCNQKASERIRKYSFECMDMKIKMEKLGRIIKNNKNKY